MSSYYQFLFIVTGCSTSISHDGGKYSGDLENGIPQSTGKWTGPDGTTYGGDFENGVAHGTGKLTFADGLKHGEGVITGTDGSIKTGTWKEDIYVEQAD